MSVVDDLEKFKSAHAPELPTKMPGDEEKPCFVCQANQQKMKAAVFNAAYQVLVKKQTEENMAGKIILITENECKPCEEAVSVLDGLIKSGDIEVVKYSACPDCDKQAISDKGIVSVPVLASRGEDGKIARFFPLASQANSILLQQHETLAPESNDIQLLQREPIDMRRIVDESVDDNIILDEEMAAEQPLATESEVVQKE